MKLSISSNDSAFCLIHSTGLSHHLKSFKKADRAMLHECALHPDRKKVLKLTGETVVDNRKFTI